MNKIKLIKATFFIGAFAFIALIWLNECLDLPHHIFGAPATRINFTEAIIESMCFLIIAFLCYLVIHKIEKRLKYLQGFALMCSNCKKVKAGDKWLNLEEFIKRESNLTLYPGLCDKCVDELYPEKNRKQPSK